MELCEAALEHIVTNVFALQCVVGKRDFNSIAICSDSELFMAGAALTGEALQTNSASLDGLRCWFRDQGVSVAGVEKVVNLCDPDYLEAQPRPASWNRRGQFHAQDRHRYLWYRHAARILGWRDRHQFPEFISSFLRDHIYPSPAVQYEEAREIATLQGGTTAGRECLHTGNHLLCFRICA